MAAAATRPGIPGGMTAGGVEAIGRQVAWSAVPAVAKLGAGGALAVDRDALEMPITRSGLPLPVVVDPVGAGDAFCVRFIAARLEGADLAVAPGRANVCGASAAAALGDQTGLPDRAELAFILRSGVDGGGSESIR